jgi:urease accessory protein
MTTIRRFAVIGITATGLAASTAPAFAHHMMGGKMPSTLMQGLLSGLGHPIIGIDHLLFIIGVGLLGGILGHRLLLPLVFIAGTLGGAALHLAGFNIEFTEPAILVSVALMAVAVIKAVRLPTLPLAAIIATAGLFHGYAYAESIFGAEPTPLYAYLIGFAAIQFAIAFTAGSVFRMLDARRSSLATTGRRVAGATMALFVVVAVGQMALSV